MSFEKELNKFYQKINKVKNNSIMKKNQNEKYAEYRRVKEEEAKRKKEEEEKKNDNANN